MKKQLIKNIIQNVAQRAKEIENMGGRLTDNENMCEGLPYT